MLFSSRRYADSVNMYSIHVCVCVCGGHVALRGPQRMKLAESLTDQQTPTHHPDLSKVDTLNHIRRFNDVTALNLTHFSLYIFCLCLHVYTFPSPHIPQPSHGCNVPGPITTLRRLLLPSPRVSHPPSERLLWCCQSPSDLCFWC